MLPTAIKQASLDDAYDAAVAGSIALRVQLRTYETAARATIAGGQVVASVSATNGAGGRSSSFFEPEKSGMTPLDAVELWRELINLFDQVYSDIGGTPTDAVVKAEMMARLVPAYEAEGDFSSLRCPQVAA